jgi:nitrate/nitrite transporter NarK
MAEPSEIHRREDVAPRGSQRPPGVAALASVLALGMAAAAAMQFVLGVLGPHLTDDFELSRTQLGLLTTGLFVVAATISPSVGRLVDRVSVSAMLRILFFLAAGTLTSLARAPTYAILLAATNVYLALYAFEELAFSAAVAGSLIAIVGAIGIGARILWGTLSPRANYIGAPLAVLGAGAVLAQLCILAAMHLHPVMLWLGVVVFGGSAAAWNSVAMYALIRELAAADTGRASGWYHVGFFSGFMVAPVAFGWVVDSTQTYTNGWLLSCGLFLVATVVAWRWRQVQATQARRSSVNR